MGQRENVITAKRHNAQVPKSNRNDCKNGKQINLLVKDARKAVQKSQITADT